MDLSNSQSLLLLQEEEEERKKERRNGTKYPLVLTRPRLQPLQAMTALTGDKRTRISCWIHFHTTQRLLLILSLPRRSPSVRQGAAVACRKRGWGSAGVGGGWMTMQCGIEYHVTLSGSNLSLLQRRRHNSPRSRGELQTASISNHLQEGATLSCQSASL